MKQFILPLLVNLADIEKFHVKRKLNEEEIAAKLLSMTPETRVRKESELANMEVDTWLWRLRQTSSAAPLKPKFTSSKVLEELFGKNEDWGHLSRGRQRRRIEKIDRDVKQAKQLSDTRAHGMAEKVKELQKIQAVERMQRKLGQGDKPVVLEATKSTSLALPPPDSLSSDLSPSSSSS